MITTARTNTIASTPAERILPRKVAIIVVHRANVRVLIMGRKRLRECFQEEFDRGKVRQTKTTGTDHLGAANHPQRKALEQVRRNLRSSIRKIEPLLSANGADGIVLAGSTQTVAALKAIMSKRLQSRVIGTIAVDTKANLEEIRTVALSIVKD